MNQNMWLYESESVAYDSGASAFANSGSVGPMASLQPCTASSRDNTMNIVGPLQKENNEHCRTTAKRK